MTAPTESPSATPALRRLYRPTPEEVPEQLEDFLRMLGGPCWISLDGTDSSRLRIACTLLHGNEPSGARAMHTWLRSGRTPAVDAVFYIASVQAALLPPLWTHRQLPGGRDANRCFMPPYGGEAGQRAQAFAEAFFASAADRRLEALIDLHNNSGRNPAYGVGAGVDTPRLNLTSLFGDIYMDSDLRLGTLMELTTPHCPTLTVECGRAADPAADAVALTGLDRFLSVPDLRLYATPPAHIRIYRQPVRVRLRGDATIAFAAAPAPGIDVTLRQNLDDHNLTALAPGAQIGWLAPGAPWPFEARGKDGEDVSRELFTVADGRLETLRPMVPVMMTVDVGVARNDCLFYALEAFPASAGG